ncbi:MAG TPA: permease-like cell division protein FtsX [Vicinamibacteria bacterium]|nr:permease-like cell division protein FtsX [Vicinamibacteria bacterium]
MMVLRAFRYFVEEALTSLWRSRLITGLSVITIAVSLFVLGAFLSLASNLAEVVARWSDKVQVTFYLEDQLPEAPREGLQSALRADPAVESVAYVSREEALRRFRALFREMRSLPEDLGENPFPAALEVTLKPSRNAPAGAQRLVDAFQKAPGVEDVEYDLLWIQRLTTAVRLVRGAGAFLGAILVLAAVFTISNVMRLTMYARQDELDIMRLVGAAPAYVKGPFVLEGMIQGGLGGVLALGLLWGIFHALSRDLLATSDLLGRTAIVLPPAMAALIVVGGTLVGLAGSLVSLGRLRL